MASFMALGYMSTGNTSAATAFSWLQDLVAISAFTHWIIVFLVYLRFYYGCKASPLNNEKVLSANSSGISLRPKGSIVMNFRGVSP